MIEASMNKKRRGGARMDGALEGETDIVWNNEANGRCSRR